MKTEEYIETIVSAHSDMRWMDSSELRTVLTSVMEFTREEERINAVNQLQVALTAIIARGDNKINFGEIIDQFKELLNE